MKPTIWIFSLEPIQTRYTGEWYTHVPKILATNLSDKFNIVQVNGIQKDSQLTPGAFLNFSDTNYWKSSQLCTFLEHYNNGETSPNDHFLFTDFWNPTVIQVKYIKELLGLKWVLHGLAHAGSYDPQDFLGRIIGDAKWVRHAENSFFHAFDHTYFATEFHIDLFARTFEDVAASRFWSPFQQHIGKIVRTGWPMEYMEKTLRPYVGKKKRDLILFPHRIAPEKQVEIFRDLAKHLPQYEFVVCQDSKLTKTEYHTLLSEAKIIFSANLQETLGISCYEGVLVDAIPMVPDRLSYCEMYDENFKYPSEWTESFESYEVYRDNLCELIKTHMEFYVTRLPWINKQKKLLTDQFFSADELYNRFTNAR
jgi:hypothetical protein